MSINGVGPNFFMVGAPKCGTTSMYHYLRKHPEVFMPVRKEPHFWSSDLYRPRRISTEDYYDLFKEGTGRKRVGEASTEYLYSTAACNAIKSNHPEARIIIMLRNPIDMIHSWHSQGLWRGRENIQTFEEALAAEADRKKGKNLPPNSYPVETLFYSDMGKYSTHVKRYLETFGRPNVHIIILEHFATAMKPALKELCTFLDINMDDSIQYEKQNMNKKHRFAMLPRMYASYTGIRRLSKTLPKNNPVRVLTRKVVQINTKYEKREPMKVKTREMLTKCLRQDVYELSDVVGIDLLTSWSMK